VTGWPLTGRVRLIAIVGVVAVLLGAGVFVGIALLSNRVDNAIPQTDLFGDETPTPGPTTGAPSPTASPTPPPGADIKGPLNILIAGVDTRETKPSWIPRADAVMVLHVNADLTKAYLTSLPRDLVVNVPAFSPAGFGGARTKIAHAMSYGSQVPGSRRPNPAQGFQLLARTVSAYTGISRFDAGAILTFSGLWNLVDELGGIDVYVDQRVVSIHRKPDGHHRPVCGGCEHGYGGPRMTYNVGMKHMSGWMALDYARQRYIPGADYARGRHQRQVVKAIVARAFAANIATKPLVFDRVLKALGKALVFDGRGRKPVEFAYALRKVGPGQITLVGLPGASVHSGGGYIGESLLPVQSSYFAAVRSDKVDAWVASHSNLVNKR
jgi:polyisoprenyl-teichoic acid--peptidoglycan teichoic acid transferase